jgi:hypothetical protein
MAILSIGAHAEDKSKTKKRRYPPGDYVLTIERIEMLRKDYKSNKLSRSEGKPVDVWQLRVYCKARQTVAGQQVVFKVDQNIELDSPTYKSNQLYQLVKLCKSTGAEYQKGEDGNIELDTDDLIGLEGVARLKKEKRNEEFTGFLDVNFWLAHGSPDPAPLDWEEEDTPDTGYTGHGVHIPKDDSFRSETFAGESDNDTRNGLKASMGIASFNSEPTKQPAGSDCYDERGDSSSPEGW